MDDNPYSGLITAIAEKVVQESLGSLCTHPSITMEMSINHDRVFYCTTCKKRIEIPFSTEMTMKQSDLSGIVGIAFGEQWKKVMESYE